jgi:hypothetical protein
MDTVNKQKPGIGMESKNTSEMKRIERDITEKVKEDVIYTIRCIKRSGQQQIIQKTNVPFYDIMKMN